jgi:hypothetical protein
MGRWWIPALALSCALGGTPGAGRASTGQTPDPGAAEVFRHYRQAVERTFVRDEPGARRFLAVAQVGESPYRVTWHRLVGDMDGDGGGEVLLERWRFTIDPIGFGFTGDYRAQVLNGANGRVLWTYRNEFHGGFPALAIEIRLSGGEAGLLFPKIDNQSAQSPTYRLTLEAVDSGGQGVWTRAFTTTCNLATGGIAGTDVPSAFQRFDPDGDAPTDFLVALTDYVKASVPDRAVARSEVFVLDARDGSMKPLGEVGPDVYWFHSIQAGPDLDGLGGDDIVIAGEENSPDSYLEARSGVDGGTIWRTEAYLGWYPWAAALPDMNSDGSADLIVGWDRPNTNERVFQISDARGVRPLWKAEGTFPYLLGDQDGDGTIDVGAYDFVHKRRKSGARFKAFSRGRLLYEESHVERLPECSGFCISGGFYLNAGDLDGDALRDTYVLTSVPTNDKPKRWEYAVADADGSLLYQELDLAPVRGTLDRGAGGDLVGFERTGAGVVRVTAYDGITRRSLWSRSYRMTGARNLGPYGPYGAAMELDGHAGVEVVVTLAGRRVETLLALDGTTGEILWQRPVTGAARVGTSPEETP